MATSITDNRKRKGPGRPRVDATLVGVRFPPEELAALDAYVESEPDKPTRPEAIRRLVRKSLTS